MVHSAECFLLKAFCSVAPALLLALAGIAWLALVARSTE